METPLALFEALLRKLNPYEVDANFKTLRDLIDRLGGFFASQTPGANQIPVIDANKNLMLPGRLIGGFGVTNAAGIADWNNATNTVAGFGPSLLHGNANNGPTGVVGYYHVMNIEYNSKTGAGNLTQFAIPYYYTAPGMYMRSRYNGTWTAWMKFITQNPDGSISLPAGLAFPATQVASSDPYTFDDYREGTFTATATGMTTSPTGVVTCAKGAGMVFMELPHITGISNATTFTLTGMPTYYRPSAARIVQVRITNNGGTVVPAVAVISTGDIITIYSNLNRDAFTAAGTKSVEQLTISYPI
jgi:hypothetical protein